MALLARKPEDRPPSAQAVAEYLAALEPPAPTSLRTPLPSLPSTLRQAHSPRPVVEAPRTASRPWKAIGAAVLAFLLLALGAAFGLRDRGGDAPGRPEEGTAVTVPITTAPAEPIVVGILHSLSGTLRESETPVMEMTRLALDEVNAAGGLLGRPVKYLIRDGRSEETVFAREAERLITQDKVSAIFGCWTSASRKAVKDVVETHNHLLFYPVQYEGLEQSPNIVYLGAGPQSAIVAGPGLVPGEGPPQVLPGRLRLCLPPCRQRHPARPDPCARRHCRR